MVGETFLEAGFITDVVATPEAVREALRASFYHILVLDKSLEDGIGSNRDGLDLLEQLYKDGQTDAVAVVVLTAYNNKEITKEAFRRYQVMNVVEKQAFDNLEFIAQISEELPRKLQLNRSLAVTWNGPTDAASEAVANLRINGSRVRKDTPLHGRLTVELDDLIARVFADADSVIITPIERGRSGSGVVVAEPFFPDGGGGQAIVLKFGHVRDIQVEKANYHKYVQRYLHGSRTTNLVYEAQTPLLGAIGYSLLDAKDFESLTMFYRRADVAQVMHALDNLFLNTCKEWYSNMSRLQARDLAGEYRERLGCTEANLTDSVQKLKVKGSDLLTFDALDASVTVRNPLRVAFKGAMAYGTYECVTHGDLNDGNVLVDHTGTTWLIDFLQTGPGHVLRDFALLDVSLRCCAWRAEDATLEERLFLERALLESREINASGQVVGKLDSANERLQKAFAASLRIRSLAAKQVHQYASADMRDYLIACFFYALNVTRYRSHLDNVQREHGLLAAGLIAEHLKL